MIVNQPFFSVIIPLYNKESTVLRTVKSILSQSFDNFEIIVVNDGSKDRSEKIVSSIRDSRIKIFNQINSGVSSARNNGAKLAKSNFVTFLDADDTWLPNFLEEMHFLIHKYPKAGLYASNNYYKYPSKEVFSEDMNKYFHGKKDSLISDYFKLFADIKKSPFLMSSFCISKDIFNEFNGFKTGVKLTEDSDFWCRIALQYDIAYTTEPLSIYNLALDGCTHEIFDNSDLEIIKMLEKALEHEQVEGRYISSVKKLITFQKMCHVKRAILTNNKLFVLKKIFNIDFFHYYPFDTFKFLIINCVPHIFINYWKIRKYK